jgi:hypothetical protein
MTSPKKKLEMQRVDDGLKQLMSEIYFMTPRIREFLFVKQKTIKKLIIMNARNKTRQLDIINDPVELFKITDEKEFKAQNMKFQLAEFKKIQNFPKIHITEKGLQTLQKLFGENSVFLKTLFFHILQNKTLKPSFLISELKKIKFEENVHWRVHPSELNTVPSFKFVVKTQVKPDAIKFTEFDSDEDIEDFNTKYTLN